MLRLLLILLFAATLARADEITLKIEDVESDTGHIAVLFFATADGFPNQTEHAVYKSQVDARRGTTEIKLAIPAGTYAVCVIHDANQNGKLDRNFFGIPTEGVGISNGIRREKPTFTKAAVQITPARPLTIPLKYW